MSEAKGDPPCPASLRTSSAAARPPDPTGPRDLLTRRASRPEPVLEINARVDAGGPEALWGRRAYPVGLDQNRRTSMELLGCGTPVARVHRPNLVAALARDMIEATQPMSRRRGAKVLASSRQSIWRWRMAIIGALKSEADNSLAGIVEANQRESRKGARELGRQRRGPANHPSPPRLRWLAYQRRDGSATAPTWGWKALEKELLAATDRAGHRSFEAIACAGQAAIYSGLLPVMAQDAVL